MAHLSRRDFHATLARGLGAATLAGSGLAPFFAGYAVTANAARPDKQCNILFISSDQHSGRCIGYMGHPVVKTPNLDRIAREGVVFANAYSCNPVCVPARACMMTGMYGSDCNSFCNSTVWDGSHPTWSKRLKDAGYVVWGTGKMDLNEDFDTGFPPGTVRNGHWKDPDVTSLFRRPTIFRANEREIINGSSRTARSKDSDDVARCLAFLRQEAPNLNGPWAAYLGLQMPHPKFVGLKSHFDRYMKQGVDMPQMTPEYLEKLHPVFDALRHFKRIATPIPEERIRCARAAYYAMVTELDEYVGQIYEALRETGQLDYTLFVYTSDHGESLGENGLWLKNNLLEGAARVPLLLSGVGVPPGMRVETPVGHADLAATILEYGGIKRPSGLRGHSLTSLMHGQSGDHPGFAYGESHSEGNVTGSFMIRQGDWKYIHFTWYEDLLYNVKEDPYEQNNRAGDPGCSGIVAELKEILENQVDPEEVTLRAFRRQEAMLQDLANTKTDAELMGIFSGRLGEGQARAMISKLRGK